MEWFTRFRLLVPFMLVPSGYLVHRLLATQRFDLGNILAISVGTLPVTSISAVLLRSWRKDVAKHGKHLEQLVSFQTIWDIVLTTLAVHYAGGASGPFWPFPYVPVVVASALLPTGRSLFRHSVVAIAATAISAWSDGPAMVAAPILLSLMFLGFSAVVTSMVSQKLSSLRAQRREVARLHAEKDLAEAVARRREEILSVVSHELASPLTTLRGYVRLLREEKGRDRANEHLWGRVDRQVERLSSLADDLLEMASTSAGALRLERGPLDLVEQLSEITEGARLQFPEADIRLIGETKALGVWDRDRLDQLFGNLVSNAMKFAGAKSRLEIDVKRPSLREVHVIIKDDGPGISEDALSRIFEPFQRYSTERGGLGLGLAIAQTIVDLHEGKIWAESPDGKGAHFHVVLPTDCKPSGEHATVADVTVERRAVEGEG